MLSYIVFVLYCTKNDNMCVCVCMYSSDMHGLVFFSFQFLKYNQIGLVWTSRSQLDIIYRIMNTYIIIVIIHFTPKSLFMYFFGMYLRTVHGTY
jgi:hypothetical protein